MIKHSFPIPFKEYNAVIKAIPSGLILRSHVLFNKVNTSYAQPTLSLNGIKLLDKKCNNKYIRRILQSKNKVVLRGKFYWNSQLDDINWKKTWLLPHKFCISNKVKEVHFKILHTIYPVNSIISKYVDVDSSCSFCGRADETFIHLFFHCDSTKKFWSDLKYFIFHPPMIIYNFSLKDVICYYDNSKDQSLILVVNFFILLGKFFIHKQKFLGSQPSFPLFLVEFKLLFNSLTLIDNKKSNRFIECYKSIFGKLP